MSDSAEVPRRRRPRYAGKHPRRFEEKYKEHDPQKYPETIAKVLASGKTPAGTHVPILLTEILEILNPQPSQRVADCTLGYGGHAQEILKRLRNAGCLLGLDVDPIEHPRTVQRLRDLGFGEDRFISQRANFAGLRSVLSSLGWPGVDCLLADLGVSSMQIDTPDRGFSIKLAGPLDMRMNPSKGRPASDYLAGISAGELSILLKENSDEPRADLLATSLAGRKFSRTAELREAIERTLVKSSADEREKAVRRVFQSLRIAVNEEFSVLETFLNQLPSCLNPGGRVAILTFHSGEDRRVKKSFQEGLHGGVYSQISEDVIRASSEERRANPRASSAKLRWAIKADSSSTPAGTW